MLRLFAPLATSAVVAVAATLWSINARMAVLEDRMTRILLWSDHNDEQINKRLHEIELRLNELKR